MTSLSLFISCIGEGNGNPLQCSCLENPTDGETWWAAVYGFTQSWTRLSDLAVAAAILYDDQPKENVQISTCYLNVCENIWNDIHLAPCYNYIRSSLVHEKHIHISDPKNYCKIQISCSKHFNSHINISVQGFKYHESNQILLLGKSPR